MAMNPTTQDMRGVLNPNFDGTYNSLWPDGDKPQNDVSSEMVTISGSGFGVEPNVVFYRDFESHTEGDAVSLEAGDGEIGDFISSTMTVGVMNGHKVAQGFVGGNQRVARFAVPAMQRFDLTNAITIPPGGYMPGDDIAEPETAPGDSGWKPIWLLNREGSNSNDSEADICIPTHVGGGAFSVTGNTVQSGTRFWNYNDDLQRHWDWTGLNVFNYVQDVGNDPINDPVTQYRIFTSAVVEAETTKDVGTKILSASVAGFPAPAGNLLPENANYGIVSVNSFARVSGTNPETTQAGYTYMYCACESSDGANDFRQKAILGNAPNIEDCTHIKPKVAVSWTDTDVSVICSSIELEWATHLFIRKPDMTYEVKAI